ncbi:DUF3237 domain-containing protein [Caulobacter sp. 73W]|uniref:UPF0311 protein ABOZ73_06900 n=1 Tax=Caulobacter sp. 73W TaxID=3161137 RepID=A0AB39KY58_9CAUL
MRQDLSRRALIVTAGAASLTLAAQPSSAQPAAPSLVPVMTFRVEIGAGIEVGEVPGGRRRIVPIIGGRVDGDLKGTILPGGADWQTLRPDGMTEIWARYTIQPDGGGPAVIVTNPGVRKASAEVSARLAAGEDLDPSLYYFRASPVFETGAPALRWLTESVFVCAGERHPDHVALKIFRVT